MRAEIEQSLIRVGLGGAPDTLVAEFSFDPALPVFRGHFPGRPLVPAAFEVEGLRVSRRGVPTEHGERDGGGEQHRQHDGPARQQASEGWKGRGH